MIDSPASNIYIVIMPDNNRAGRKDMPNMQRVFIGVAFGLALVVTVAGYFA